MSKITKLISQAIMELQNIHKAVVGVDKRVEAVEQAIAPRTITGARIKEGTITLASMQATAVEAAITGNMPKIKNAMVTCGDLPVLKMEDFEQGEAAVKRAFSYALDKSLAAAEALDKSPLFPGLSYRLMGSGQNSHEYAMGQKATRSGEIYPHLEAMYKAGFGSTSMRGIDEADFTHSGDLRHSRVVLNRDLTPCFVMGLIDALAQARAVAVGADKAAQAHAAVAKELAVKLDRANHRLQRGYALERALDAYEKAQNEKPVDGFETQA